MSALFGIGQYVDHEGRRWRIADIRREPSGMWAVLEIGEEFDRVRVRDIVDELLGPVQDIEERLVPAVGPDCPELAELSPARQKSVLDRFAHLMEADGHSPWEGACDARYDPTLTLKQRLHAKADELQANGEAYCSAETLRRQLKAIKKQGIASLIHGNARSVDQRLAAIDPELLAVARQFGQRQQAQAKISQRRLLVKLIAELTDAGFDVSAIGSNKMKLILGHSTRGLGLHKEARSRRMHATKPHTVYQGKVVSRPGEVAQIDATNTVIHAWDPYAGWVRAIVLTAIDVYSRAILALRVVGGSVTAREVGLLLWDMGRPTISRSGRHDDLWHGTPDEVYVREVAAPGGSVPSDILIGQKPAVHPT